MSAWFVSKEDIDLIVSWTRPNSVEDGTRLGKMLWRENVKSLRARYAGPNYEADHLEQDAEVEAYVFRQLHGLKPVPLAKIIACYDYQSCEHEGWAASAARALCTEIETALNLPSKYREKSGWQDAPWGVRDDADLAKVCDLTLSRSPQ
jgi:hypothetical protein